MELTSLLAGEPFSDHPHCVSRPLAAPLGAYSDVVDDESRPNVYGYAARVVGSAAGSAVEREPVDRLLEWADAIYQGERLWPVLSRLRQRSAQCGDERDYGDAGDYAINALRFVAHETHASVLALVNQRVLIGGQPASDLDDISPGSPRPRAIEA